MSAEPVGLEDLPRELVKAERAITRSMRDTTEALKQAWRQEVSGALGPRLARTIRSENYPKSGTSLSAAGYVWSRASDILWPFERGAVIRSPNGFYLAIPTEAAGKNRRGGRASPGEWERRTGQRLRFVYRRGRPSLLVADAKFTKSGRVGRARLLKSGRFGKGATTIPIFILVPQVKLRKRLDLMTTAERVAGRLPAAIVARWT